MKSAVKALAIGLAAIALASGGFWGGILYQGAKAPAFARGAGPGPTGGPMANLTDEERARLETMSDEERRTYLTETFGGQMVGGGQAGPARGGLLEGEIIELADDALTIRTGAGGSQTVYFDEGTVVAYAEGAGALAEGSPVLVFAEPEADGVTTARAVIVDTAR